MTTVSTKTCCLTPKGRGAIATVVVRGPASIHVVDQCFRSVSGKLISQARCGQILFGKWTPPEDESTDGEELVVCRLDEQSVEIHCHGGLFAPKTIISHLVSLGCEEVDVESWLQLCQGRITGQAFATLSSCPTERTALYMLQQSRGLLEDEIRSIANTLSGDPASAIERLSNLLATTQFGIHLSEYWNVVFAGPPNVGKSSLMNALAGFKRSIVFDQPGTTRDLVTIETAFDGWPIRLTDTAGIHESPLTLESHGIDLAIRRIDSADLVVNVSDATDDPSENQLAKEPSHILIRNKCDLLPAAPDHESSVLYTSAKTGKGIPELIDRIVERLVPKVYSPSGPIVFSREHESHLRQALSNLKKGIPDQAQKDLEAMF